MLLKRTNFSTKPFLFSLKAIIFVCYIVMCPTLRAQLKPRLTVYKIKIPKPVVKFINLKST